VKPNAFSQKTAPKPLFSRQPHRNTNKRMELASIVEEGGDSLRARSLPIEDARRISQVALRFSGIFTSGATIN
jgi:hypothetical protein